MFSVYCFSEMELTAPMEETAKTAKSPGVSEGELLNKYSWLKYFFFLNAKETVYCYRYS